LINEEESINEIIKAEKQENYDLSEKLISNLARAKRIKISISEDANIFLERNEIKINIFFDSSRYIKDFFYDIYFEEKFLIRIYFRNFYKEIKNIFEIMNNIEYAQSSE